MTRVCYSPWKQARLVPGTLRQVTAHSEILESRVDLYYFIPCHQQECLRLWLLLHLRSKEVSAETFSGEEPAGRSQAHR